MTDYTDFRITELWVATSLDEDGEETVCYLSPGVRMRVEPLLATDSVRLEEVVKPAVRRFRKNDPNIRIRHFTYSEDVEP